MYSVSSLLLLHSLRFFFFFFFFNDTATTEIYTLSLHDALPISYRFWPDPEYACMPINTSKYSRVGVRGPARRSEEHTSELQSHHDLVCRLLLEKKKKKKITRNTKEKNSVR